MHEKETKEGRENIVKQMVNSLTDAVKDDDDSLLNSLIQSLPLNVYAKNRDGKFIFANSYYCKSTGKSLEQILGTDDYDVHPKNLADKYRMDDERIMSSGKTETIEEEWQSIGGEQAYIQVIKSPLFDIKNRTQVIGTIGVFWDITSRKLAELNLAEERNLLRTLIDNLPNYIYVKDRNGKFLLGNKAVADIMGAADADDLTGKTDFDYYPLSLAEQFFEDDRSVVLTETALVDKEEVILTPEGRETWSTTSKFPLRNLNDEVIGLVGIGKDITAWKKEREERKKLEAHLHQSQKMETVGTLAAGIAHDFNNLLNVINGYTELLLLDTIQEDQRKNILTKIQQAGQSAATLVRQLTAFSSKQVIQPRPVDINKVLQKILLMLKRIIGEKIEIKLNLATAPWNVNIDPIQMEQIVVNLAANARDAMRGGGTIWISTQNVLQDTLTTLTENEQPGSGEYVKFTFSDTGDGIAPELRERVFEPFFTTKEMHKGTGLGLATVFGIVQQNHGHIHLESEVGKGTSLHIYLPRTFEPLPTLETNNDAIRPQIDAETSILVVEDDDAVRELVLAMLHELGCKVVAKRTGAEALEHLSSSGSQFDLLLTDVVMPGMSGKELADRVMAKAPDIKVIFMSGYTDEEIDEDDITQPGKCFLQKPFDTDTLAEKIYDILSPDAGVLP